VRIRIALHYDLAPAPAGAPGLEVLAEHAVRAEAAGADMVWVAERPTAAGAVPAALPACAAIAARTARVHLGTAVLPLPLHHPLSVAEDGATLDAISGGRFELGVGLGDDPLLLGSFGIASGERTARVEEAVAVVRAAWGGVPASFEGHHYRFDALEVVPRPFLSGGPPIWVGAGAAAAQRRAALLADGLLLAPGASPAPFLAARAASGREARLAVVLPERNGDWAAAAARVLEELAKWPLDQLDLLVPIRSWATDPEPALGSLARLRRPASSPGN
jgi:alkanesulfonate monooxygenase SsuD/methylene tetrahydromethanopterin reductase-like flavin-dependent oxidoreductase (luciferase family)